MADNKVTYIRYKKPFIHSYKIVTYLKKVNNESK